MSLTIVKPKLSPFLNEEDKAFVVDNSGNKIPVVMLVKPTAGGSLDLTALTIEQGVYSHVTGRQGNPKVITPAGDKIPLLAIFDPDPTGVPVQSGGKFQSAVRVATGSSESIAHGLGVVPTLVLISVYDLNGVGAAVLVEGVHTSTNLLVTVTANVKYKVIALK